MGVMIDTTAGSVTTRGSGSLDVSLFFRKDIKSKIMPLHDAERDQRSEIKSLGSVQVTPSGKGITDKKWVDKRNDYPEGSLIKITARETKVGMTFSNKIYNMYIRARSTAALRELAVICPTDAASARSRVYIIGRFDILTPEEVEERGLHVGTNGSDELMTYDPIDESPIFEVEVKQKETSRATSTGTTTVQTNTGARKIMPKLTVKRRIRLPK